MNRKTFIAASVGSIFLPKFIRADALRHGTDTSDPIALSGAAPKDFDDLSLKKLRDEYHRYLFDDFLPFMDNYVIDHTYGGFMCNTDRTGTNIIQTRIPGQRAGVFGSTRFSTEISETEKNI